MEIRLAVYAFGLLAVLHLLSKARSRLRLFRAKHPSLQGHVRLARLLVRQIPFYEYDERRFFRCDGAPPAVVQARRADFQRLSRLFHERFAKTREIGGAIGAAVSDAQFVEAYRVPFQFRAEVQRYLPMPLVAEASDGVRIRDLDGNWAYDLSGSYGVNVLGYEFYKACLARGFERARALGPVLGVYHPVVADNVERLKCLSGMDEVSFHMSGTEAVMQAVALARYHTGRSHLVRFAGAYHGWWDGVHVGPGSPRPASDVYTLKEGDGATLRVLATRHDIACVLVSPLQALHPNRSAPGDGSLVGSGRRAGYDREAHARWLQSLREVCDRRGIVLIFDEVFSGFRIALGGAQEYYGVRADLVAYGKSLGGGLPVGVVCGKRRFMKRYRDERPADICFARGTFNAHPYVMACMNEFLRHLAMPQARAQYASVHETWDARTKRLNLALAAHDLPVRVANLASILSVMYTTPSRYNWMFQYHLRSHGLLLSWTGTGRLIMSHDFTAADFEAVEKRFVAAATQMQAAGWWWRSPGLSNKAIARQVFGEALAARLRRRPAPTADASADDVSTRAAR